MTSFIDSVQKYITNNFEDLQEVEIIVPNNRTRSALLSSLKRNATKVCWAPKITPIKDIFARNVNLHEAENVVMTYLLYKVFVKHINDEGKDTSFDNFYNFGEVLLSDFDDIDKYLVNPEKLFCNIADVKEIDMRFADLEDELMEILQSFWKNISSTSVLDKKMKSLELWRKMPDIYNEFTAELHKKGIGYQGMIYRDFVENKMEQTSFDSENYVFVGFSALNKCEKSLFRHIRKITNDKNGKCLFFWDADKYYIDNKSQEAGLFLRNDLKEFPMPQGFVLSGTIKDIYKKDIQVIEVPSSVAQTKLIPDILKEYENIDGKTAIILGDEKLLVPLVYSLPEEIENKMGAKISLSYNITMGYPLSYTASASFVQIIMKLAMHRSSGKTQDSKTYLNRKDILSAIKHSFSRSYVSSKLTNGIIDIIMKSKIDYVDAESISEQLSQNELLKVMFDIEEMKKSFPKYIISVCNFVYENVLGNEGFETESDFMHKIITLFTSFQNALGDDIAFDGDHMYYKLMTSMIKQSNMAFEGKSDDKMQILGFMETRSLDFDNIIMLSMNEDTFPKSNYKDSMIPYNLRKAFSMPSIEFQNSIFAYYFYRLLQRCQSVRMLYSTEGKISHAEKSRFITQMEYELNPIEILEKTSKHNTTKSYEVRPSQTPAIEIVKTENTINRIYDLLGCNNNGLEKEVRNGAYPKLINTYLTCPVGFYFEYIEKLIKEQSIDDDTTALDFGNLLHESCHYLYKDYIGETINKEDFAKIRKNFEDAIDYAVCKVFNVNKNEETQFNEAKSNIMIKPLKAYLKKIVQNDEAYAPFQIVDLENEKIHADNNNDKYNYTIEYKVDGKNVLLKGKIDRIDLKDGIIRVIDYKTSNIDDTKKTYTENFWTAKDFKSKEAAQVLIYSLIMSQLKPDYNVQPCIISVTKLDDYKLKYKNQEGKKSNIESFQGTKVLINEREINLKDDVDANLQGILNELLDKDKNFKQTENVQNCKYCPYNKICNKNN